MSSGRSREQQLLTDEMLLQVTGRSAQDLGSIFPQLFGQQQKNDTIECKIICVENLAIIIYQKSYPHIFTSRK